MSSRVGLDLPAPSHCSLGQFASINTAGSREGRKMVSRLKCAGFEKGGDDLIGGFKSPPSPRLRRDIRFARYTLSRSSEIFRRKICESGWCRVGDLKWRFLVFLGVLAKKRPLFFIEKMINLCFMMPLGMQSFGVD